MKGRIWALLLFSIILVSLVSSSAYAVNELTGCRGISESGSYFLKNDVGGSDCFHISASNVDFDCQGYNISGSAHLIYTALNQEFTTTNVTIRNCNLIPHAQGIFCGSSTCNIINNSFYEMGEVDINVQYSPNSIIESNSFLGIEEGYCNDGTGCTYLGLNYNSNNSVIRNNIFENGWKAIDLGSANATIEKNIIINNSKYGLSISDWYSDNSLIYDNFFNNTENIKRYDAGICSGAEGCGDWGSKEDCELNGCSWEGIKTFAYFNTTKTAGTNILGKSYLGGNYWSDYTGTSSDGDYIGDTAYVIDAAYMNDFLPLFLPKAPILTAIGNKQVNATNQLNFTISATDWDGNDILSYFMSAANSATNISSWATFNSTSSNLTFVGTPTELQNGTYNVIFAVSDNYLTDTEMIFITVLASIQSYASKQVETVTDAKEVIFNGGSNAVETIVIPSTVTESQNVMLNLNALLNSSQDVELNMRDLTLMRQTSTTSYSAIIQNRTIIFGGSDWDGKIILPTVKNAADYSASNGTVDVVIDLGSGIELNFSNAVKVILGGQAGKRAAWTRGTVLNEITTVCNSATNPTNINSVSPRECYINSGSDLIIWTYHFTKFAAYSIPTTVVATVAIGASGGGGCLPQWTCTGWSACSAEGIQTRTCTNLKSYCPGIKPAESQSCTYTALIPAVTPITPATPATTTPVTAPITGAATATSGITGAVIKGLKTPAGISITAVIVILLIGLAFPVAKYIRKLRIKNIDEKAIKKALK